MFLPLSCLHHLQAWTTRQCWQSSLCWMAKVESLTQITRMSPGHPISSLWVSTANTLNNSWVITNRRIKKLKSLCFMETSRVIKQSQWYLKWSCVGMLSVTSVPPVAPQCNIYPTGLISPFNHWIINGNRHVFAAYITVSLLFVTAALCIKPPHLSLLQMTRTCSCVENVKNSLILCQLSWHTRGSSASPMHPPYPQCHWPPPTPTHPSPQSALGHRLLPTDKWG